MPKPIGRKSWNSKYIYRAAAARGKINWNIAVAASATANNIQTLQKRATRVSIIQLWYPGMH